MNDPVNGTNPTEGEHIRLSSLSDDELRTLQAAFPLVINDASNPRYDFHRKIWEECKKRQLM